jgi:ubiquinone/menaquinone biosynthesis C-methylase UbiE
MRDELRRHYLAVFRPGDRVLDVGCGTGTEAVFMAANGMRVTAMDVAPEMIAETRRKTGTWGLEGAIETVVADLRDLDTWPADSFDGILSTYAALNMVNSLAGFSASAARLLRRGGRMVLHLSNRFSVYEWLGLILHCRLREARRLRWEGERHFTMRGLPMVIYVSSPAETYTWFFEPRFELASQYALGVIRPHADPRWAPRHLLSALGRAERSVRSRRPLVGWGRFFVLELVKRG